jgi:hypothetical protein
MKLIHYGSLKFDPLKWKEPILFPGFNKPRGGFWASPIDSKCGWDWWCRSEAYKEQSLDTFFEFEITGKILRLRGETPILNMNELIYRKVDALYLPESMIYEPRYWGWDCESVVILNKDIIRS